MSASLNGQQFEYNVLSIHFESFNKDCVAIKEAKEPYMLRQKTKLKRVNLPSCFEIAYPCFIKAVISIRSINITAMNFLGQIKSLSEFGMQWN